MLKQHSYIYNKVKSICLLFTLIVLASCDAENSISTKNRCDFAFYTQNHPGNSISTALEGYGTYTFVSTTFQQGKWHVYSTLNDGKNKQEDITITSESEMRKSRFVDLGANHGIILGRTNFNGYVAWDRQCPNCIPYNALEWDKNDKQAVTCSKCQRTYALETGNITSGADGSRLMRYRISYEAVDTGTGMVVLVYNY